MRYQARSICAALLVVLAVIGSSEESSVKPCKNQTNIEDAEVTWVIVDDKVYVKKKECSNLHRHKRETEGEYVYTNITINTKQDRAANLKEFLNGTNYFYSIQDNIDKTRTRYEMLLYPKRPRNATQFKYWVNCKELRPEISCAFFEEITRFYLAYFMSWINVKDYTQTRVFNKIVPVKVSKDKSALEVAMKTFRIYNNGVYTDEINTSTYGLGGGSILYINRNVQFRYPEFETDAREYFEASDDYFKEIIQKNRNIKYKEQKRELSRFQNTFAHEFAHVLGLSHSDRFGSLEFPFAVGNEPLNPSMLTLNIIPSDIYAIRFWWNRTNQYTVDEQIESKRHLNEFQTLMQLTSPNRRFRNPRPEGGQEPTETTTTTTTTSTTRTKFNVDDWKISTGGRVSTNTEAITQHLAKLDPYNAEVLKEIRGRINEITSGNDALVAKIFKRIRTKLFDIKLVGNDTESHEWISSENPQELSKTLLNIIFR